MQGDRFPAYKNQEDEIGLTEENLPIHQKLLKALPHAVELTDVVRTCRSLHQLQQHLLSHIQNRSSYSRNT